MDSFTRQVVEDCARLGMPGWQRFLLVLALAILRVCGRQAVEAIKRIELPKPEPGDEVDEGGKVIRFGAREGGGPAGGGPEGGMGG